MSLTSQQRSGELGDWMRTFLTGARTLAGHIDETLATAGRPVSPVSRDLAPRHWADIGGAFGQRLAFLTQHAPPYYALYGTLSAELADWRAVHRGAACFPTHRGLTEEQQSRACDWRPIPGGWLDLGLNPPAVPVIDSQLVTEFMTRLRDYLSRRTPQGQFAGSLGAETTLARACWVLNGWEGAYRSGRIDLDFTSTDVSALLNLAPGHALTELLALTTRAHASGALDVLRSLAGNPAPGEALGIAGPVFVPHWADGDLLIGDTLLDVKTVMHARNHERTADWLRQLLAYTWLDVQDRYRIRRVGLYLARHGKLLTWPIDTFTHTLLGSTDSATVAARYGEFRRLAGRVIADEGADPRHLQVC
ncbi:hypothetical protein [Pseudonocardia spinosispora]|uniref:hypothetical protein n=1 Tax=Pseudonocardia spinosispora TaxID=103441 RepID=UPI00040A82BE|nr:hypothetical protein [Pseudonocardia spinosispora]